MYKRFLLVALPIMGAMVASAAPIACPTGTVQDYTTTVNAAGGCFEDGLLFNQFQYLSTSTGTAVALPSTAVAVAPLINLSGAGFGFQITGGFAAGPNSVSDGILQYQVTPFNSTALLTTLNVSFNGTATGSGIAGVSENYCLGGTVVPPGAGCGPGNLRNIFVQTSSGGTNLQSSATFAGVNSLTVSKDIQVNGGASGTATISSVTNQFQTGGGAVPEPGVTLLLGSGLIGLAVLGRQRLLTRSR